MASTFIALSDGSRRLLDELQQTAAGDRPVWLVGAPGSGRGYAARHLHRLSDRPHQPCVEVDCAALDPVQARIDLHGCEPGAAPGVFKARPGWFELTHGGTLILKEVHALPAALQDALARVLSHGTVARLGGRRLTMTNTRLVLAAPHPPQALSSAGLLCAPLAASLEGRVLHVPPLAERPLDIAPLAQSLIAHHGERLQREPPMLTAAALAALAAYPWPDNLREMDAWAQRLLIQPTGPMADVDDLGLPASAAGGVGPAAAELRESLATVMRRVLDEHAGQAHALVEQALFTQAYEHSQRNQIKAARLLGVSRNVLRARLIEQGAIDAKA